MTLKVWKTVVLALLVSSLPLAASAEEAGEEKTGPWTHALSAGLNFMQTAHRDWAAEGQDSILIGGILDGSLERQGKLRRWTTTLHAEYGSSKVEGQDRRKAQDALELTSELACTRWERWEPYTKIQGKTQFDDGLRYFDEDRVITHPDGGATISDRVQVSQGLDPLTLQEELGARWFAWKADRGSLSLSGALAGRQLITDEFYLVHEDETLPEATLERVEEYDDFGLVLGLETGIDLTETARWSLGASYFAPFDQMDEGVTTGKTTLALGLGEYFSVEAMVELLDDPNISDELQIRESLMLRLSVKLL